MDQHGTAETGINGTADTLDRHFLKSLAFLQLSSRSASASWRS
jgi:hypothetical protein